MVWIHWNLLWLSHYSFRCLFLGGKYFKSMFCWHIKRQQWVKVNRSKPLRDFLDFSLDSTSRKSITLDNISSASPTLPRKRPHVEKYYPFPRYTIKSSNGLNTLKFTLTVTLFAYPFKTDVGYEANINIQFPHPFTPIRTPSIQVFHYFCVSLFAGWSTSVLSDVVFGSL
jgi:hypothetical protein